MSWKKYKEYLLYNPKDRNITAAKKWFAHFSKRLHAKEPLPKLARVLGLSYDQLQPLSLENLYDLFDILTLVPLITLPSDYDPKELFFPNDVSEEDSIHNPNIGKLIFEALDTARKSQDEVHDFSHIIRTTRLARMFFNAFKKYNRDLDWGILATAMCWHDNHRVFNRGFLYNKDSRIRKKLRSFTPLVDAMIAWENKGDSLGSCIEFYKHAKPMLPKALHRQIAISILGEHRFDALQERIYPGIVIYKNIVFWADHLDILNIARWMTAFNEQVRRQKKDIHLLNRYMILNTIFNIPRLTKKFTHHIVHPYFDIITTATLHVAKRFCPTDGKLLASALREKSI